MGNSDGGGDIESLNSDESSLPVGPALPPLSEQFNPVP